MLLEERAESERLRQIIKALQRHRFGRRAESLPEDQLLLGLEEAEQVEAAGHAQAEEAAPAEKTARSAKRRVNRGALPAHLPRVETLVDVTSTVCPCCSGPLHRIGEDVSERLDIVPAQVRVLVIRRPKYACRACEDGVVQAPAPARLIEGGLPTDGTVAQVLVSKFADHLPLYRQAQIYARQGLMLERRKERPGDSVRHGPEHLAGDRLDGGSYSGRSVQIIPFPELPTGEDDYLDFYRAPPPRKHDLGWAAEVNALGCDHQRSIEQHRMGLDRVEQLVVGQGGVAQAQLIEGVPFSRSTSRTLRLRKPTVAAVPRAEAYRSQTPRGPRRLVCDHGSRTKPPARRDRPGPS